MPASTPTEDPNIFPLRIISQRVEQNFEDPQSSLLLLLLTILHNTDWYLKSKCIVPALST